MLRGERASCNAGEDASYPIYPIRIQSASVVALVEPPQSLMRNFHSTPPRDPRPPAAPARSPRSSVPPLSVERHPARRRHPAKSVISHSPDIGGAPSCAAYAGGICTGFAGLARISGRTTAAARRPRRPLAGAALAVEGRIDVTCNHCAAVPAYRRGGRADMRARRGRSG